MSLQDQFIADIDGVFLCPDEFATAHEINGVSMLCVVDDNTLLKRSDAAAQGIYLGERLLHIKASLLPGKPAIGARMTLDGKPWFVTNLIENFGMYEIRLGANKT